MSYTETFITVWTLHGTDMNVIDVDRPVVGYRAKYYTLFSFLFFKVTDWLLQRFRLPILIYWIKLTFVRRASAWNESNTSRAEESNNLPFNIHRYRIYNRFIFFVLFLPDCLFFLAVFIVWTAAASGYPCWFYFARRGVWIVFSFHKHVIW